MVKQVQFNMQKVKGVSGVPLGLNRDYFKGHGNFCTKKKKKKKKSDFKSPLQKKKII